MMKEVKLGDICNILNGYAFKSKEYVEDGIRVIRITNVQKGNIEDNDPKYYDISKIEELKNYMLKENDLLISLTGNVGRVGLLPKKLLPAGLNQRVGCLRIKDERNVSVEYLYQYFNSYNFERDCINNSKGIAQKNLSTEWLKNYKVSIPNLNEQNRIANELKKIQRLKKLKEQQLKELNQLIKSQFVEMFENNKFEKKNLGDVAIKITDGSHNPPKGVDERTEYVMLSSQNIIEDKINYNNARYLSRKDFERENKRTYLEKGDVLLTIVGTIGRTAVIDKEKNITLQRSVAVIKPIEKIKSEYLVASLKTDSAINQLNKRSKGVAQKGIYLNDLKKIFIPVPPITPQNQFSKIVKQIDKQKFESMIQLDKENRIVLKNIIKDTLEETNSIYEFLFKKYFEKGK